MRALLHIFFLFTIAFPCFANDIKIPVELYVSSTCPHCQKEEAFFKELQTKKPWIVVNRHVINEDKAALEQFNLQLRQMHLNDYTVPAAFFCKSRWTGFANKETTGKTIEQGLDYCYQQLTKGKLKKRSVAALNQIANANTLLNTMTVTPSPVSFLTSVALMDAFSPCSLFIIATFFAFLWLYKDQTVKIRLGLIFLVVLGLAHHLQQSHIFLFYELKPWFRVLSFLTGVSLLAYLFLIFFRSSANKPPLAVPILVACTAFVMELYQQTCSPNFALVFQQWLSVQNYTQFQNLMFNMLYQVVYLLPLLILMFLFAHFHRLSRLDKVRVLLICFSWCTLFLVALFLIFQPQWFSRLKLSFVMLAIAFIAALFTARQKELLGYKW